MSLDPHRALEALVTALEEHLAASLNKRGDDDSALDVTFERVSGAFEEYEDALYAATGEVTPLDLFDDSDELYDELTENLDDANSVPAHYLPDDDEYDDADLAEDDAER